MCNRSGAVNKKDPVRKFVYDREILDKVKGKLPQQMVRPAMLYSLETAALAKAPDNKLGLTEMRLLRYETGVSRKDQIRK